MAPPRQKVAVIGLGYIGLPLVKLFIHKGDCMVYGIDIDKHKMNSLLHRKSYLSDFSDKDIQALFAKESFQVGSSFDVITDVDVVIICVPTPIDRSQNPDLTYIREAIRSSAPYLHTGQVIILESSTYPGTTEEELLPVIESQGLKVGKDVALVYSPERVDPGQQTWAIEKIPKVLGGVTPFCTQAGMKVYETIFDKVVAVSSARAAEMTKLLENSQRFINISFMNEIAMVCKEMKIDVWEIIQAAGTKPFGFTPYYPGPGIGGHCIPVDPLYLHWKAKQQHQFEINFISLANKINEQMPSYIVHLVEESLQPMKRIHESRIFVIGAAFKKNVNDYRESKAVTIIERLKTLGAVVYFYDPYIEELKLSSELLKRSILTKEHLQLCDCTLILTDHSCISYDDIVQYSPLVIDTRNATSHIENKGNVILL
ncbi:nucleotide sugar dehydrogenase [Paenibacillus sp. KQZ6P-2]|uniref:Nucleotide sugar dehydrogenase n=1 Tax=Paenibacillus mangrovi TaxID=2931978 RepID=A0A9X2B3E7_9BACL|nr:nucleotide sugar dehydrogenase [Paenibacillus mangrovi]MCJ8013529.1 nucleotide sugar dehydrogenase [Paenibacillus mangrovi]